MRGATLLRGIAFAAVLSALFVTPLAAQRLPAAPPSRADSLIALGYLAGAENELYAAVRSRPRAPAPRGALGHYLSTRAQFRIAEILLDEALRFGADTGSVRRAIAAMRPYRSPGSGPVVVVPFQPSEDGRTIGTFVVQVGARDRTFLAVLDPQVTGVIARTAVWEFSVAGRRFASEHATADPSSPDTVIRVGLDVLWAAHPMFDERAGTMTLGRAPNDAGEILSGRVQQIPFLLTFPGMSLVPRPGRAPVPLGGPDARALLRGSRWQVNAVYSTLIVVR